MLGCAVAARKSTRSRRRRAAAGPPKAVASTRREVRAERAVRSEQEQRRAQRQFGREGERPPGPFGGLPVSEFAILAGLVAAVVGVVQGGRVALVAGLVICALGVVEITAREHFSGYRSHTSLLAGIPAVGVEVGLALLVAPSVRLLLLLVVVPVYAVLFWLLRRRFLAARQRRVAARARPAP